VRVLAALSGGVDSAVAAARAVDAGHDVTAVHLALSPSPLAFRDGARGCCSLEDSRDARRAADVLGIPFYVWDVAEEFRADVIDDFVAEYASGRTPNPCLRCNEKIKFSAVLDRALALGFDAVATGHYARLITTDGRVQMHRAVDAAKDQSYVLAVVRPDKLEHAMFPLGDSLKTDVRAEAARRGLAVADKPDSHDICFVTDGDTAGFLRDRLGEQPGAIVDTDGNVVGEHDGAYAFTVGQRRGLRLGVPAADGKPRYVLDVSPVTSTVTVGPAEELDVHELTADRLTVLAPDVLSHDGVLDDVTVQVRAHGTPVPARVRLDHDAATLTAQLHEPVRGVAAGQAAVVYAGTRVIASATLS
jgi:tRNA-specific 2-thiouridylase